MGRNSWSNRQMVENCRSLSIIGPDIRVRIKTFFPDSYFLVTSFQAEKEINRQDIFIRKTRIFNKAFRNWFACPKCHRRVLKLYMPPRENFYACRICHNLTYRSQKRRNGFQERWLMQFTGSRRLAWELLDSLHGKRNGLR
jgi:hypothetical protein